MPWTTCPGHISSTVGTTGVPSWIWMTYVSLESKLPHRKRDWNRFCRSHWTADRSSAALGSRMPWHFPAISYGLFHRFNGTERKERTSLALERHTSALKWQPRSFSRDSCSMISVQQKEYWYHTSHVCPPRGLHTQWTISMRKGKCKTKLLFPDVIEWSLILQLIQGRLYMGCDRIRSYSRIWILIISCDLAQNWNQPYKSRYSVVQDQNIIWIPFYDFDSRSRLLWAKFSISRLGWYN